MTEPHLSVDDVYNVINEHMSHLDTLWPDSDQFGPRKVHVVELIDAIKLRLCQIAEKNANRYESAFEKAARKITGTTKKAVERPKEQPVISADKSAMQLAHEAAQSRMRNK